MLSVIPKVIASPKPAAKLAALQSQLRRAQPKRIARGDGVVAGVAVEVDAPREPDGILGQEPPGLGIRPPVPEIDKPAPGVRRRRPRVPHPAQRATRLRVRRPGSLTVVVPCFIVGLGPAADPILGPRRSATRPLDSHGIAVRARCSDWLSPHRCGSDNPSDGRPGAASHATRDRASSRSIRDSRCGAHRVLQCTWLRHGCLEASELQLG